MTRQPDYAAPGAFHPLFRIQPLFHIRQRARRPGERIDPHHHDEAQLILALSGTTQIHTDTGRWLVPPQLAVWIPAGITHRLDVLSGAEMRLLHWHPDALRRWAPALPLDREFALRVSPLLRELTQAAFAPDTDADKQLLIGQLILHELNAVVDAPTYLPLPTSLVGQRVAQLALTDTGLALTTPDLAAGAATSVRTLSRLFPAETGLTFRAWRQRARIVRAIDHLARGKTIAQAAGLAGFSSTAAFSYAFRQVTGGTPSGFMGDELC